MSSYLLSIDQGTTGTTVLLFDPKGRVKGHGYHSFKQYYPKPGWVEHEPEEIWNSLKLALKNLVHTSKVDLKDIKGIGITNKRETAVLWNPNTSKCYGRAIVWQCRRTTPVIKQLKQKNGFEEKFRKITGLPLDPYFSASKIKWMLDENPALRKRAKEGEVLFGTIDSFLLWRLTGGKIHATDFTNASRTYLFDIKHKIWSEPLLKVFGVPRKILPKVLSSKSIFGHTKNINFLPDGIPIAAMIGDQQAALFGQKCYRLGEAKNTYGTGSFFMVQLGKKRFFSNKGFLTTLAVDKTGHSTYALEGSVFVAGAGIQWIRDELGWVKKASDTEAIAYRFRKKHPHPYVFMIPAFVGLGVPYWNPEARGAFIGLTRGTTQEELITSTLESLAYPVAEMAALFREETKTKLKSLKVDGGGSRNNYLMQFQSNLLGIPVIRPKIVEATALGAGKLAGMNLNFWEGRDVFDASRPKQFLPSIKSKMRESLMSHWTKAIRRVL